MTVYFQGAEREDFTLGGTINTSTNSAQFNPANARFGFDMRGGSPSTGGSSLTTTTFSTTEFWTHFVQYFGFTAGTVQTIWTVGVYSGATAYIALKPNGTTGWDLMLWNGSGFTTITSVFPGTQGLITYDLYIKLGNSSTGQIRVYRNGIPMITVLNVDTSFGGTVTEFTSVRFGSMCTSTTGSATMYSEVIVADWNTLGSKLVTLVPNAAGNYNEFAGAGYTAVDEVALTSDLMTSSVADERFSVGMTDPPALGTGESIEAVAIAYAAARDGVSPQNINTFVRIGGVDYHNADQSLSATLGAQQGQFMMSVDPSTSAQWQVSAVTNAEFGVRSRT